MFNLVHEDQGILTKSSLTLVLSESEASVAVVVTVMATTKHTCTDIRLNTKRNGKKE